MGFKGLGDLSGRIQALNNPASTTGITLTSGAVHTKGSFTSLGTLEQDAYGFFFTIFYTGGTDGFIDIAIANNVNAIIVENLFVSKALVPWGFSTSVFIPLYVPKGTTLYARCSNATAGTPTCVSAHPAGGGLTTFPAFGRCKTYGADPSDSTGLQVTTAASGSTMGAKGELTASCAQTSAVLVAIGTNNIDGNTYSFMMDILVGGSGMEKILIPKIAYRAYYGNMPYYFHGPFYVNIPAGERLTATIQGTSSKNQDVIIYCFS